MLSLTQPPIRIVLVDDHAGIRAALRRLLADEPDITVVAEGETGQDALNLVHIHQPDILLLDLGIPVLPGHEVVKRLQATLFEGQVLVVSGHDMPYWIDKLLVLGAAGYVTKEEVPLFLLIAIRALVLRRPQSDPWLSPQTKERLDHYYRSLDR